MANIKKVIQKTYSSASTIHFPCRLQDALKKVFLFVDNTLHYKVILHVPVVLVLSYIFLFRICVTL